MQKQCPAKFHMSNRCTQSLILCLPTCLPVYIPVSPSTCLPVSPSPCLPVSLSPRPSTHLSWCSTTGRSCPCQCSATSCGHRERTAHTSLLGSGLQMEKQTQIVSPQHTCIRTHTTQLPLYDLFGVILLTSSESSNSCIRWRAVMSYDVTSQNRSDAIT